MSNSIIVCTRTYFFLVICSTIFSFVSDISLSHASEIPEAYTGFQRPVNFDLKNFWDDSKRACNDGEEFSPDCHDPGGGYGYLAYAGWSYSECSGTIYHPGIDINRWGSSRNEDAGEKIYAVADGIVQDVDRGGWGTIVIEHNYKGQTLYSQYGHVSNILVNTSDKKVVKKGMHIADLSNIGTTYAHLHFEIRESRHPNPKKSGFFCSVGVELENKNSEKVDSWYENPIKIIDEYGPYRPTFSCLNMGPVHGGHVCWMGTESGCLSSFNVLLLKGTGDLLRVDKNYCPPAIGGNINILLEQFDPDADVVTTSFGTFTSQGDSGVTPPISSNAIGLHAVEAKWNGQSNWHSSLTTDNVYDYSRVNARVEVDQKNGSWPAGNTCIHLHLSDDKHFQTSVDPELDVECDDLRSGKSAGEDRYDFDFENLDLSDEITNDGTFYLFAKIRPENGDSNQSDEDDGEEHTRIEYDSGLMKSVDVVVSGLSDATQAYGQRFVVPYRITNVDGGDVPVDIISTVTVDTTRIHENTTREENLRSGGAGEVEHAEWVAGEGDYHLLTVCAQVPHGIRESNTSNNCDTAELTVVPPPRPDLVVEGLRVAGTGDSMIAGELYRLEAWGKNDGAAPSDETYIHFYTNTGGDWGEPIDREEISRLGPGQSDHEVMGDDERAPSAPGTYRIRACIDQYKSIAEESDTNNCQERTITVRPRPLPDLIVSALSLSGGNTYRTDQKFGINAVITNDGQWSTGRTTRVHYDVKIGTTWSYWDSDEFGALGVGQSASEGMSSSAHKTITTPGTHQIRACADAPRYVAESNESNNCRYGSVTIIPAGADLQVTTIKPSYGRTHFWTGEYLDVDVIVTNNGNRKSDDTRVSIEYTVDGIWRGTPEGSQSVDDLNPGESDGNRMPRKRIYRVPLRNQSFQIKACVDYRNDVAETNERNNCKIVTVAAKQKGSTIPYLGFSSNGPIIGSNCYSVNEPSDPHTWSDNYFCSRWNYKMRWSSRGAIPGMACTQISESAEKSYWRDNYMCVDHSAPFRLAWYSAGVSHRGNCVRWHEPSDPNTWHDNYMCWGSAYKARSDGSYPVTRYYNYDFGAHYYDIYSHTRASLENRPDWKWDNHGNTFYAFASRRSGTVPVYRCWTRFNAHIMSRSKSAAEHHCNGSAGIAFYAYATGGSNRVPVRQLWHPRSQVYLYSNGEADANSVVAKYGYVKHGIVFYTPK